MAPPNLAAPIVSRRAGGLGEPTPKFKLSSLIATWKGCVTVLVIATWKGCVMVFVGGQERKVVFAVREHG